MTEDSALVLVITLTSGRNSISARFPRSGPPPLRTRCQQTNKSVERRAGAIAARVFGTSVWNWVTVENAARASLFRRRELEKSRSMPAPASAATHRCCSRTHSTNCVSFVSRCLIFL